MILMYFIFFEQLLISHYILNVLVFNYTKICVLMLTLVTYNKAMSSQC